MKNELSCPVNTSSIDVDGDLGTQSNLNGIYGGGTVIKANNDLTAEASVPTASLESVLCTEELHSRRSRSPDFEKENRALVKLASALADSPSTIFQTLAGITHRAPNAKMNNVARASPSE